MVLLLFCSQKWEKTKRWHFLRGDKSRKVGNHCFKCFPDIVVILQHYTIDSNSLWSLTLLCSTTVLLVPPHFVLVHLLLPSHVQYFVFVLKEFHIISFFLSSFCILIMCSKVSTTSCLCLKLGTICTFIESTLTSILQLISEDIEQYNNQDKPLRIPLNASPLFDIVYYFWEWFFSKQLCNQLSVISFIYIYI